MPGPDSETGAFIEAAASSGKFSAGALVGPVSLLCHAPLLGVNLHRRHSGGTFVVPFHLDEILIADSAGHTMERLAPDSTVACLRWRRVSSEPSPALMEFLLAENMRTVLLHGSGIPVVVTSAARQAFFSLRMAGHMQRQGLKRAVGRELWIAWLILAALATMRQYREMASVLVEMCELDSTSRELVLDSLRRLPQAINLSVNSAISRGLTALGIESGDFGL